MNVCCICIKPFKARKLYAENSLGDGCPGAPLICAKCREHPAALSVAVELLKEHLGEVDLETEKNIHPPVPVYSGDPWALVAKAGAPAITMEEVPNGGEIR